jgi:hypothetical protein
MLIIQSVVSDAFSDASTHDGTRLSEMETNLLRLLTEMTRQAGALGLSTLHEKTLSNARAHLGPLGPCRGAFGVTAIL